MTRVTLQGEVNFSKFVDLVVVAQKCKQLAPHFC